MQVVRPVVFTPAMVTSNNLTDAHANYNAGTSYSIGNRVTYNYRYYESLINANLGNTPNLLANASKWLDIGPSNRWATFDNQVSTKSTSTTNITLVIVPGAAVDTVALLNITGAIVSISVKDAPGGTVIYTGTQHLGGDVVLDWFQYFFFDVNTLRTLVVFRDIPLYGNCEVTLTITAPAGVAVGSGQIVMGVKSHLGMVQYGMTAGIIDFSKKETDETFGTTTFLVRGFTKKLNTQLIIDSYNINRVQRTLYGLRATPALWLASDDPTLEEPSVVYGFYRDFSTEISYPTFAICNIEIEGLI